MNFMVKTSIDASQIRQTPVTRKYHFSVHEHSEDFLHPPPPPPPPHFKSISPVPNASRLLFFADEQVAILCIKRYEFVRRESKSGDH